MDKHLFIEPPPISEKRKFIHSVIFPLFFIFLIWSVKIIELASDTSFAWLGIYPRQLHGLIGILTAPLIHSDFDHLIGNSIPLLIFSVGTFYFYRPLGYKVFFWTYLITGLWVWCWARSSYHIGASGVVYGLASFLFFSGILRRIPGLAAVSLIVVFLYGGMIWGIFPIRPEISWESHLSGGVAGLLLSLIFRKEGPQPKVIDWGDDENENEESFNNEAEDKNNSKPDSNKRGKIVYLYKPKDESGKES